MPVEPEILLTKENILSLVSQEQIFEAYLGLPIDTGTFYINPLRLDRSPGCRFYYKGNKLYFHDFGKFHWDCFAVVQHKFGCKFIEALRIIARDFRLNNLSPAAEHRYIPPPKEREVIKVSIREWEKQDLDYWKQFNITLEILKRFNVYPCKSVWMNDQYYRCKRNDPCYCYYFGKELYKLYFPMRKKGENKFFQNLKVTDDVLQGIHQLDKGSTLILTKSYKDVMSLYSFGIPSVAVHSEYHLIRKEQYEALVALYPRIITLFDNDSSGRILTAKYIKTYQTEHLLFPMGWNKDFSDNVKKLKIEKMKEICQTVSLKLKLN